MSRILADMKAFGTQYLRSRVGTFFALVFPILLILLFGAIFGSSGSSQVTLYVQDLDNQQASHAFTDALNKTNVLTIRAIPASADFSQYIRDHSINVALLIPAGFQQALSRAENGTRADVNLTLAGDQTQSSYGIAVSAVDAVATAFNLKVAKAAPVVNVLPTSVPGLRHLTYIDLFLPGIIGFTILSTPLFGMTAICAEYRSRRYFKLLATTKLSKAEWLAAKVVFHIILLFASVALMVLVGILVFGLKAVVPNGDSDHYRRHARIHLVGDGPRDLRSRPRDRGGDRQRDRIPHDVPGGVVLPCGRDALLPPDGGSAPAAHLHQ